VSDNKFVTADPQFGNMRCLRPFATYKDMYDGQHVSYSIGLFEDGVAHDPQAGKPGYDPRLCRGLSVPLGARVVFWIPNSFCPGTTAAKGTNSYVFDIIWRARNLHDFRANRIPYHVPKQTQGVIDTTPITGGSRVIIPSVSHTIGYSSPEPAIISDMATVSLYQECVSVTRKSEFEMLDPDGNLATIQQGLSDPNTSGTGDPPYERPGWALFETQAVGDELIMGVTRRVDTVAHPHWEFSGVNAADILFSGFWDSSSFSGVYVFVGSAP
jgi:hypothetical protein